MAILMSGCPKCGRTGPAKHEAHCMRCDDKPPSLFVQAATAFMDGLPFIAVITVLVVGLLLIWCR